MKQKAILLAGALALAGGVAIAVPATGQASEAGRGQSVSTPSPYATVAGEWGTGRKNPRA
ncbi:MULTISPECIES: hypothetical protein [Streptomyces]|uniref:Chitinase n=1 Tax=Streptomyces katrae TaxID=68223 RepID=A0ABT7GYE4_9ACTN|nr:MULTISPECIES: hypothetical protein [Streptomyces]MDK9498418.1 hypothetical protein [Streptomyces katrae]GLX19007.1 hypothetical protein Slala01_26510 [Streptomyces lavendulae subsp. lavendulae]GLX31172.1 hypothetical protein Slala02_69910 [Streptomyces lavendulae subsp. lavendulae]